MSGIERNVDKLGRIVLPIKYRERLEINTDDKVIVSLDEGVITISPSKNVCALCGREIQSFCRLRVCRECVKKIKEDI
jgi:bifunctional DNA-binding transcriptional regulator/antitoxin component of YhaV-PrlF toxin-antitoxin module